jgi:hypothetical protein
VISPTVIGAANVDGTCLFAVGAVTSTTGVVVVSGPAEPSSRDTIPVKDSDEDARVEREEARKGAAITTAMRTRNKSLRYRL